MKCFRTITKFHNNPRSNIVKNSKGHLRRNCLHFVAGNFQCNSQNQYVPEDEPEPEQIHMTHELQNRSPVLLNMGDEEIQKPSTGNKEGSTEYRIRCGRKRIIAEDRLNI